MDEYNDREARFLAPYKRQDLANAIRNNKTKEAIKIIEENNNQKKIEHKFDLNKAVKGGDTLLGLATQYKNNDIINLLLKSGASVNKADIFNKTPDLYIEETNKEMKNKLTEKKAQEQEQEKLNNLKLQDNKLNKNDNSNIFLAILTLLTTIGTGVAIAAFAGGKRFSKNKAIKRMKRIRTRRMRTRRIKATKGKGKTRNLRK
jgi:hypothetical protein